MNTSECNERPSTEECTIGGGTDEQRKKDSYR